MACKTEISPFKVLYATDLFQVVTPSDSATRMILQSKIPCSCSGSLSEDAFNELSNLKEFIASSIDSPLCFYEYGARQSQPLSIHIFLQEPEGFYELLVKKFNHLIVKDFQEIPSLYDRFGDYIYFENTENEKFFFCISTP